MAVLASGAIVGACWRTARGPRAYGPPNVRDTLHRRVTTTSKTMRVSRAAPASGFVAQLLLLGLLAETAGLGAAGRLAGTACAVVIAAALASGLGRDAGARLGPASWVTLARATLAVGVAGLVADSFVGDTPVWVLVALAAVALALDLIDGWLARRTGTESELGARFDGEVDAFLILALSVYVARTLGAWVLAIGAARYVFLAGEALLPWMRAPLPPRRWRKVVAALQGVVLTIAASGVLPRAAAEAMVAAALVLLAASMGECTWWLWRRRHAAGGEPAAGDAGRRARGPVRTGLAVALTAVSALLVWVALVAPDEPSDLTVGAFVHLPLELLVVVGLAVVLPATPRRVLAVAAGALLSVLVVVKVLDIGFFTAFDRAFDPIDDLGYAGIGVETLGEAIGRSRANLVVAGAGVIALLLLLLPVLALLRVTRVAAGHRDRVLPAAAALGVVWVVLRLFGAPAASTAATDLALREVRAVQAGLRDHDIFARRIAHDRFRATPANRLLTGLRGRDVVLLFVESYGKVAVQGSSFSPRIDTVLDQGTADLRAAGFGARSAFMTSPTFGGLSWLAHSTLQSGVWVSGRRRYAQLVHSRRLTLSRAFKRAGWRVVGDMPANDRTWREGAFYHYDKVYDRRDLGYRGPRFGLYTVPDQYVLLALQRFELGKPHRRPIFAEVDTVSSHGPWSQTPALIPWADVRDGSSFAPPAVAAPTRAVQYRGGDKTKNDYASTIDYSLRTIFSFVQRYGNDKTVYIVLGDHQPATLVSGEGASHEVPISVIARDPKVLDRIGGWGWDDGMRPRPQAPVWPMSAFRDRFLTAFGSTPAGD
jgi:phosphatidylglycerophosphate synthase